MTGHAVSCSNYQSEYITWAKNALCIQADVLRKQRLLLYPVYHLGEERVVYSTGCTACIALSDISPGLRLHYVFNRL